MTVESFIWMIMCVGATLAAIAIAYRLGHTVGYKQAERLTLPRVEKPTNSSTEVAASLEEEIIEPDLRPTVAKRTAKHLR